MESEINDNIEISGDAKLASYKSVCARLGLFMCVYYACRIVSGIISAIIVSLSPVLGGTVSYLLATVIAIVFSYIVPIYAAMLLFKSFSKYGGSLRMLYKKPRRLARALGTFPAMYGMGFGIALLTALVSMLISKISGGQSLIDELFRPTSLQPSTNIVSVLIMYLILVVAAPVFEEFLVRGIMYDALKPYGCGMAIIISSVLFGLMHGSLYMLFYATALGFALAYVRYATGSLFVTTILHALINSVSGSLLLISSLAEMTGGKSRLVNTFLGIYFLAFFILVVLGVVSIIKKIPTIRKYRIENEWADVKAGRKTALFFLSVPVMIMLVLAINEHANNLLLNLIIK